MQGRGRERGSESDREIGVQLVGISKEEHTLVLALDASCCHQCSLRQRSTAQVIRGRWRSACLGLEHSELRSR